MGPLPWLAVGGLTATWTATYRYLDRFDLKTEAEYKSRVITLVYAFLVIACAVCTLWFERNGIIFPGQPNTPIATFVCVLSLSYFLFDFGWAVVNRTEGPLMLLHHVLCIAVFSWALFLERGASEVSTILILAELSNPYLQFRYFVKQSNWKRSWQAVATNVLFVIMYFVCRMILMPHALWLYVYNPDADRFISYVGMLIYAISWFWWLLIMRSLHRRFFRQESHKH